MSQVILDFGSGETCKNDTAIVKRMIDELVAVDTHKHEILIKWQLFLRVEAPVPPLRHDVFYYAYQYAAELGYLTTASVFDYPSLSYLLDYHPAALKIACRPYLYNLVRNMPRETPIYISVEDPNYGNLLRQMHPGFDLRFLHCVPEYPASRTKYETMFGYQLSVGISDHTTDLQLFKEYQPMWFEKHYRLEDSTGLDAGAFAATPRELAEIL